MKTSDFDFPLPEGLIAKRPLPERDTSRLLVVNKSGAIKDRHFTDLPAYLRAGDMLVLNRTKVLPMRLWGTKPNGKLLHLLLVKNLSRQKWEILSPGRYTGPLTIAEGFSALVTDGKTAELDYEGDLKELLWRHGEMPLPPYIKRRADEHDKKRYQTVYAEEEGSIAAPTAGLHFTNALLQRIKDMGVIIRYLTLHVGTGTFTPIRADLIDEHRMDSEYFEIDHALIDEIQARTGRLIAVGTTTTRALEGYLSGRCVQQPSKNGIVRGSTDIFIYPGYGFRAVDGLITNFHLPGSTPLMLVSAICGREILFKAYDHAIRKQYRFFSYGDAMLTL